jgi:coenzyme F420-0:L-glutamate ligase / coenzyme F420-1:gamma-L-glutamate ligase
MDMSRTSLLDAIQQRRSIRQYRPDPVAREVIDRLLTAATWAPSAHNRQPWRFAVVQDSTRKQQLVQAMGARLRRDLEADGVPAEVIAKDVGRSSERMTSAPVLILVSLSLVDMDVYPDPIRMHNEMMMAAQSTAMAGQNLLLAAHEAGLGAVWMCAPLFCPDIVRAALELPDDWQPQGLIALGYPAQEREKTRHPLEKSVLWR